MESFPLPPSFWACAKSRHPSLVASLPLDDTGCSALNFGQNAPDPVLPSLQSKTAVFDAKRELKSYVRQLEKNYQLILQHLLTVHHRPESSVTLTPYIVEIRRLLVAADFQLGRRPTVLSLRCIMAPLQILQTMLAPQTQLRLNTVNIIRDQLHQVHDGLELTLLKSAEKTIASVSVKKEDEKESRFVQHQFVEPLIRSFSTDKMERWKFLRQAILGVSVPYHQIRILGEDGGKDWGQACKKIHEALTLRDKYQYILQGEPPPAEEENNSDHSDVEPAGAHGEQLSSERTRSMEKKWRKRRQERRRSSAMMTSMAFQNQKKHRVVGFRMVDGIVQYSDQEKFPFSYEDHVQHIVTVTKIVEDGPTKSSCRHRLTILAHKYDIHSMMNFELEANASRTRAGGDFYSARKVDNCIRLATCTPARSLHKFIVQKALEESDAVVDKQGTKLIDLFHNMGLENPKQLTIEKLAVQPGPQKLFHRFDIFSKEYSRGGAGSVALLELFLRRSYNNGKWFADLVRPHVQQVDAEDSTQATEYRIPLFGFDTSEWFNLANWVMDNGIHAENNRWIIQVIRISGLRFLYKCKTQQEQMDALFIPMWQASVYPDQHPNLAKMLRYTTAINIICNESTRGQDLPHKARPPAEWPWSENPPDLYFNYYVWANLVALNAYRSSVGLNVFQYRPNAGEMGGIDHLVSGFLLADSIMQGVTMEKFPALQYLYYIAQIGISMSPLSNNGLHKPYAEHPFPLFFKRGLRVSLGTDGPLHFHHTLQPLNEEYGTAIKLYKLSGTDICEVARNSVLISGFEHEIKCRWLGKRYLEENGNDYEKSNVPDIRIQFRGDVWNAEYEILNRKASTPKPNVMQLDEELCPALSASQASIVGPMTSGLTTNGLTPGTAASGRGAGTMLSTSRSFTATRRLERVNFDRVDIIGPDESGTSGRAALLLKEALDLRHKYISMHNRPVPWVIEEESDEKPDTNFEPIMVNGICMSRRRGDTRVPVSKYNYTEFIKDMNFIMDIADDPQVNQVAYKRLQVLEHKFGMHKGMNSKEEDYCDNEEHRDFYQTYKVDVHVHMSSGMPSKCLNEFMVNKMINHGDDIVAMSDDGNPLTLSEFIVENTVDVDAVDARMLMASNFEQQANSINAKLRSMMLHADNYMGGRYFAELIKQEFTSMERDAFKFAENRLTISGKSRDDWIKLSHWYVSHGVQSLHNKWMIQLPPEAYYYLRRTNFIHSFQDFLDNIFLPLWEVSIDPNANTQLSHFLRHMSGFDCVSVTGSKTWPAIPTELPSEWTRPENPPYAYYLYYLYANISSLNTFRASRGLSVFSFRPHCGEEGGKERLSPCFLIADGVSHCSSLMDMPSMEYLYYLTRIGLSLSPLSGATTRGNNYSNNPFPVFLRRGLNATLSTDVPLALHHTREPLLEEYAIANKMWQFSPTDMCEIARNSVLQSGFGQDIKKKWLGELYFLSSSLGNYADKSHCPDIRVAYRFETYHAEVEYLESMAGNENFRRYMLTINEEDQIIREYRVHISQLKNSRQETARSSRALSKYNALMDGELTLGLQTPTTTKTAALFRSLKDKGRHARQATMTAGEQKVSNIFLQFIANARAAEKKASQSSPGEAAATVTAAGAGAVPATTSDAQQPPHQPSSTSTTEESNFPQDGSFSSLSGGGDSISIPRLQLHGPSSPALKSLQQPPGVGPALSPTALAAQAALNASASGGGILVSPTRPSTGKRATFRADVVSPRKSPSSTSNPSATAATIAELLQSDPVAAAAMMASMASSDTLSTITEPSSPLPPLANSASADPLPPTRQQSAGILRPARQTTAPVKAASSNQLLRFATTAAATAVSAGGASPTSILKQKSFESQPQPLSEDSSSSSTSSSSAPTPADLNPTGSGVGTPTSDRPYIRNFSFGLSPPVTDNPSSDRSGEASSPLMPAAVPPHSGAAQSVYATADPTVGVDAVRRISSSKEVRFTPTDTATTASVASISGSSGHPSNLSAPSTHPSGSPLLPPQAPSPGVGPVHATAHSPMLSHGGSGVSNQHSSSQNSSNLLRDPLPSDLLSIGAHAESEIVTPPTGIDFQRVAAAEGNSWASLYEESMGYAPQLQPPPPPPTSSQAAARLPQQLRSMTAMMAGADQQHPHMMGAQYQHMQFQQQQQQHRYNNHSNLPNLYGATQTPQNDELDQILQDFESSSAPGGNRMSGLPAVNTNPYVRYQIPPSQAPPSSEGIVSPTAAANAMPDLFERERQVHERERLLEQREFSLHQKRQELSHWILQERGLDRSRWSTAVRSLTHCINTMAARDERLHRMGELYGLDAYNNRRSERHGGGEAYAQDPADDEPLPRLPAGVNAASAMMHDFELPYEALHYPQNQSMSGGGGSRGGGGRVSSPLPRAVGPASSPMPQLLRNSNESDDFGVNGGAISMPAPADHPPAVFDDLLVNGPSRIPPPGNQTPAAASSSSSTPAAGNGFVVQHTTNRQHAFKPDTRPTTPAAPMLPSHYARGGLAAAVPSQTPQINDYAYQILSEDSSSLPQLRAALYSTQLLEYNEDHHNQNHRERTYNEHAYHVMRPQSGAPVYHDLGRRPLSYGAVRSMSPFAPLSRPTTAQLGSQRGFINRSALDPYRATYTLGERPDTAHSHLPLRSPSAGGERGRSPSPATKRGPSGASQTQLPPRPFSTTALPSTSTSYRSNSAARSRKTHRVVRR